MPNQEDDQPAGRQGADAAVADRNYDDWLRRIEATAQDLKEACAAERRARECRVAAQIGVLEAISEDRAAPPTGEAT